MEAVNDLRLWAFLLLGMLATSESWTAYDRTAYTECTPKPKHLLYDGGIITNPDFNDGLTGWSPFGSCVLQLRSSQENTFVVAVNRTASYNGPSQPLANLTSGVQYSLSAWLQVNGPPGTTLVKATVVTDGGRTYTCAGSVLAQTGCWSFLKGGFALDSTPATSSRLYFETTNFTSGLEIWLDRVSLQPFRAEEWLAHQTAWRESLRRRKVSMRVVDSKGRRVRDANIEIVRARLGFPFGSAMGQNILTNQRYQEWFVERFNTAVFENELKWYSTEQQRGRVDYNVSDRMVAWCEEQSIAMRGHNIFWEDPRYQQGWIKALSRAELREAAEARLESVVGRYAGRFAGGWDVSNEQLHFSFYEDALGDPNISTRFFLRTQELDPHTPLFVNDYNVVETCNDAMAAPDLYVARLRQLQAAGVANLAIGLESHFSQPNLALLRSSLDKLGSLALPIWLTELDINVPALANNLTKAAGYLEQVLQEAFSHPAVSGIMLWTGWHPNGCYRMCLTDSNFTNLPTGQVVDMLLQEWRSIEFLPNSGGTVGTGGELRWHGPIGIHNVIVHWNNTNFNANVEVVPGKGTQHIILQTPTSPYTNLLQTHDQEIPLPPISNK